MANLNQLLEQAANLAITHLGQVTLLLVVVGMLHRVLATRTPRLMLALWTVAAVKAITPPLFASSLGLFSWAQAPGLVAGVNETGVVAVDWAAAAPGFGWLLVSFAVVWAVGFVVSATAAWRRHVQLDRILSRDALPDDDPLVRYIAGLAERYGLKAPNRVVVSQEELGPAVAGIWRTSMILPERLIDDRNPATLRPVLLHELVHTTRHDTVGAMLHTAVRVVWWFNPLVWWAGRQAESLVERCVDLTVTRDLQTSVVEYGRGLLRVLELRSELNPQAELTGIRPCQITMERLQFLRDAIPPRRLQRRVEALATAGRWALGVALAAALLPALPASALVNRCDPAPERPVTVTQLENHAATSRG